MDTTPTTPSTPPVSPGAAAPPVATTEDRTVAILSYITLIGFIAAVIIHSNKKTQLGAFHLRQTLGIFICTLPIIIPFLGWIWGIFVFVMWIMGLISAVQGEMKPLPLVGPLFQKWFSGAFN